MNIKQTPMVKNRKESLPTVYGDTPSFLGGNIVKQTQLQPGYDVLFAGVPWEGTITWGTYSGCESAPKTIRHAAARYGGFLPEYELDLLEYLKIGDIGDISVNPNDPNETMKNIYTMADQIFKNKSIPIVLGGDHSITPEIVNALSENKEGQIGIIHFDAHLDNNATFGDDTFPRCGPLHRIAQNEKVRNDCIVHIGIRGPRNSSAQFAYAREMGATIFHMGIIRKRGIKRVIEEAINIASNNTDSIYITICSDVVDVGFNPGGPPDFNGLSPSEFFYALHALGQYGFESLDYVEVYPIQDATGTSSHLASWAIIYALNGLASMRMESITENIH